MTDRSQYERFRFLLKFKNVKILKIIVDVLIFK